MDTIEMIQNAILNTCEDAKIIPWNNGGIQVTVEDPTNIPGIVARVADTMYEYDCDDVQITTNQNRCEVYIDICDREEDDEEWEEDEEEERLKPGMMINWCPMPVVVKGIDRFRNEITILDAYGVLSTTTPEEVIMYNPGMRI